MGNTTSPALMIISAMITPALLILGSASLVATALQRLARTVDRARALLQIWEQDAQKPERRDEMLNRWLDRYTKRSLLGERVVSAFFAAVGIFVLDCLSIAVDHACRNVLTWLPVSLTIIGMILMFSGAYGMLIESRLAGLQIREEIQQRRS
ncbi:MAG TPA: DUF2721 domain-containing protein [Chthonomonadaceae bacterium]|nr:DUF2721 domain-containing protein [Chthonomonadaceae bacterium]